MTRGIGKSATKILQIVLPFLQNTFHGFRWFFRISHQIFQKNCGKKMLKRWPELYGLVLAESAEKRKNQFKVSIKKNLKCRLRQIFDLY